MPPAEAAWVIAPSERLHLKQDLIFLNFNLWPLHPDNEAVLFRDEPVGFSLCVKDFLAIIFIA